MGAIRRIQTGREGSDCTAPYDVLLDHEYTVEEFIDAVLEENPREWGKFAIHHNEYIFGYPQCGYRNGKTTARFSTDILKKKILKVTASGGWTLMDYLIWTQE